MIHGRSEHALDLREGRELQRGALSHACRAHDQCPQPARRFRADAPRARQARRLQKGVDSGYHEPRHEALHPPHRAEKGVHVEQARPPRVRHAVERELIEVQRQQLEDRRRGVLRLRGHGCDQGAPAAQHHLERRRRRRHRDDRGRPKRRQRALLGTQVAPDGVRNHPVVRKLPRRLVPPAREPTLPRLRGLEAVVALRVQEVVAVMPGAHQIPEQGVVVTRAPSEHRHQHVFRVEVLHAHDPQTDDDVTGLLIAPGLEEVRDAHVRDAGRDLGLTRRPCPLQVHGAHRLHGPHPRPAVRTCDLKRRRGCTSVAVFEVPLEHIQFGVHSEVHRKARAGRRQHDVFRLCPRLADQHEASGHHDAALDHRCGDAVKFALHRTHCDERGMRVDDTCEPLPGQLHRRASDVVQAHHLEPRLVRDARAHEHDVARNHHGLRADAHGAERGAVPRQPTQRAIPRVCGQRQRHDAARHGARRACGRAPRAAQRPRHLNERPRSFAVIALLAPVAPQAAVGVRQHDALAPALCVVHADVLAPHARPHQPETVREAVVTDEAASQVRSPVPVSAARGRDVDRSHHAVDARRAPHVRVLAQRVHRVCVPREEVGEVTARGR